MSKEIERKFIVDSNNQSFLKLIADRVPVVENRYYLLKEGGVELRFTSLQKNEADFDYTLDRMEVLDTSLTVRTEERIKITKPEFNALRALVLCKDSHTEPIVRNSYHIQNEPKLQLKVYEARYDGLVRAEVEFDSVEDCESYVPLDWMGAEISDTPIGNDVTLANLSREEFETYLATYV